MEANMKHKDIYKLLKTLNIPVAYDHFDSSKTTTPPFVAYREVRPETFKADGVTYYRPYEYEIELVTSKKDLSLEQTIEELLTTNKIPYDKSDEGWDEKEKTSSGYQYTDGTRCHLHGNGRRHFSCHFCAQANEKTGRARRVGAARQRVL